MDTALDAMKRAARAVLKDELKALRLKVRKAQVGRQAEIDDLSVRLGTANLSVASYKWLFSKAQSQLTSVTERVEQVKQWAEVNRVGDYSIRACAEYIGAAEAGVTGRRDLYTINPFDRWQVSPRIEPIKPKGTL